MKVKFFISLAAICFSLSACSLAWKNAENKEIEASAKKEVVSDLAVYENKYDNIKFKYDKDLAYKVDDSLRYEGFVRYIGFASGESVQKGANGYPVEFVIIPAEKESEYVNGGRYISGFKKGDKFYYFSTYEKDKYGQTVDKMAETLEFLN